MKPVDLIAAALADGVTLRLDSGKLKVTGDATAVNRWLPLIREQKSEIIEALKVGAGETATASRWWLIHYADRDPVEVACCPDATQAEILERHPDAFAAEPFTATIRQPLAPMTAEEEAAIGAWLALIEATYPASIAEVIGQCRRDADARDYFTGLAAAELPKPDFFADDRRTCNQCANLIARRCQSAKRGEIVASRNYEPIRELPRRCEGYEPGPDDPDRGHGRERWPGLIQKGGE